VRRADSSAEYWAAAVGDRARSARVDPGGEGAMVCDRNGTGPGSGGDVVTPGTQERSDPTREAAAEAVSAAPASIAEFACVLSPSRAVAATIAVDDESADGAFWPLGSSRRSDASGWIWVEDMAALAVESQVQQWAAKVRALGDLAVREA